MSSNLIVIEMTESDIERFWKYVNKKSDDECWEWLGCKNENGYGLININYKKCRAHRVAWVVYNNATPKSDMYYSMCVCHTCDNPGCVNPRHLFLGTHTDNMRDMGDKGRRVAPGVKGEKNGNHKLTEKEVAEIREKYIPYKYSLVRLAKEYNVACMTIYRIVSQGSWKHVD